MKTELINGNGYLFLTVMLSSHRKSMHGLSVLYFLSTKKKTAPSGEEECLIIPAARGVMDVFFHGLILRARKIE